MALSGTGSLNDSADREQRDAEGQDDAWDVSDEPPQTCRRRLVGCVSRFAESEVLRHVEPERDQRDHDIEPDRDQPQAPELRLVPVEVGGQDQAEKGQEKERHDGVKKRRELRPESMNEIERVLTQFQAIPKADLDYLLEKLDIYSEQAEVQEETEQENVRYIGNA